MSEIVIGDTEKAELARFLSGVRSAPERAFWYIGSIPGGRQSIAEELRGYIESEETGIWLPMDAERMPCCDGVKVDKDNKYSLLYHCAAVEHIRELVNIMSAEQLQIEYQWMLDSLYSSLVGNWSI